MAAFKKNQQVTVIGKKGWVKGSFTGTTFFRQATVLSCGKKIMNLVCNETGENFGRSLNPEKATEVSDLSVGYGNAVYDGMTDEEAHEMALLCSEKLAQSLTERWEECIRNKRVVIKELREDINRIEVGASQYGKW
jgi:hypothetical protein